MHHSRTNAPQATDEPLGRLGGPNGDIPILELEGSGVGWDRDGLSLQFQSYDHDDAVRYLTALAAEATALVEQIRVRQRMEQAEAVPA